MDRFLSGMLKVLYYIVPSLDVFDMRLRATHNLDISGMEFFLAIVYGFSYTVVILLASYLVIRRRKL